MTKKSRVELILFDPQDVLIQHPIYNEKQIMMEMECSYEQFPNFLYKLANFSRLFVISNLRLLPQPSDDKPDMINTKFTLKTYLLAK